MLVSASRQKESYVHGPHCCFGDITLGWRHVTGAIRCPISTQKETNMSERRYPNESREYRDARDSLLKDEQELVDKVKSVAERRRNLPLGGQLKED